MQVSADSSTGVFSPDFLPFLYGLATVSATVESPNRPAQKNRAILAHHRLPTAILALGYPNPRRPAPQRL
jgi:hypothetical protein